MQVLVVEDEGKIANILRKGLLMDLYNVDIAGDGEEALEKVNYNSYDFIILDVMLPKIDGLTVCRDIRKKDTSIPILILTAKDDVHDKIAGLDAGADDYVTKPFSYAEISARIRALLRRGNKADPVILSMTDITLNPATKIVTRANHAIFLTTREFALLEYLMRNQNIVLTKSQILEHVWNYQYEGLSNIVETYIKYLRKKLKVYPHAREVIHTVHGTGYCLRT
jgi:two-component system copper resistance phosphate regulon response regulator CusR